MSDADRHKLADEALKESENLFKDLAEKSLVGVYLIQDGVFRYINPKLAEIFGYAVEELMGKKGPKDLVFPEDYSIVEENIRKRISGELESTNYRFRGIKKNKEMLYIEVYGSRTTYQGHPAVIGTLLDITEHKRAEEQLRRLEDRYRTTLDNMLEGCQIIGYDWRYLYVNDVVAGQGRRTKEELLGHTMMEIYPGIENTEMFAFLKRCMEKRVPHRMENEFTFPDGSRGWFELSIQPTLEGIFILSQDITERKKAEEELKKRIEELEEFHRVTVGRELKMIELEKKVNELVERLKEKRGRR